MSFEDEAKTLIRLFVGYSALCVSIVLFAVNHWSAGTDYSREEIIMHSLVIVLGLGLAHPELLFKLLAMVIDKIPFGKSKDAN